MKNKILFLLCMSGFVLNAAIDYVPHAEKMSGAIRSTGPEQKLIEASRMRAQGYYKEASLMLKEVTAWPGPQARQARALLEYMRELGEIE